MLKPRNARDWATVVVLKKEHSVSSQEYIHNVYKCNMVEQIEACKYQQRLSYLCLSTYSSDEQTSEDIFTRWRLSELTTIDCTQLETAYTYTKRDRIDRIEADRDQKDQG